MTAERQERFSTNLIQASTKSVIAAVIPITDTIKPELMAAASGENSFQLRRALSCLCFRNAARVAVMVANAPESAGKNPGPGPLFSHTPYWTIPKTENVTPVNAMTLDTATSSRSPRCVM